jgi:hypothetical protein
MKTSNKLIIAFMGACVVIMALVFAALSLL